MASSYRSPSDIYPSLTCDDAPAAIEWLCRAFGISRIRKDTSGTLAPAGPVSTGKPEKPHAYY